MANNIYGFIALTGGTGALDRAELDGSILADKDIAVGVVSGYHYVYDLDADSGSATSGELIIAPPNAGDKRWILRSKSSGSNSGDETATRLEALILNTLKFDTTPVVGTYAEGTFRYSELWHSFEAEIGRDVTIQIGQEELRRIYNDTGSTILNGKAVYTNGVYVDATPNVATVALAQANSSTTYWCLGLATQDIPHHSYGFITVRGHINDVDTSAFADGDVLYLSATDAGELVTTKPEAPNYAVRVGRVIKAATAENHGVINVRLLAAVRMNDIADVQAPSPVAGQVMKFDGVSWVPADTSTVASAGGTDYYLSDADTDIEGMTRAATCVVTWTGHGHATGDYVQFTGITQTGWTALNWTLAAPIFHKITWIDVDHFSIPVNTSGYAGDYVPATDPGVISSGRASLTPVTTAEVIDSAQSTGSVEALIDTYSSPVLGVTSITAGEWAFKTWCYASSITNVNTIVIRVYKRIADGTETELFSVETADLGTTNSLSQIASVQSAYTILATDCLVFKYYAKSDRGAGAYRTCYLTHNGTTHYTYIKSPIAMLHNQLGGLDVGNYQHMTAAQESKLDAIEALADVTDTANVSSAGAVMEGDYAAYSILAADTVDVPQAIELAASQLIGRKSTGGIVALAKADLQTIINVADGANNTDLASPSDIGNTAPNHIYGWMAEIYKTASADSPLTAVQCSKTIVSNYGMTDADCTIDLPTAVEGLSFIAILSAASRAKFFKFHCPTAQADKIYLLGVAGSDDGNVGVANASTLAVAQFFTFKDTAGDFNWFVIPIFGTWVAS